MNNALLMGDFERFGALIMARRWIMTILSKIGFSANLVNRYSILTNFTVAGIAQTSFRGAGSAA